MTVDVRLNAIVDPERANGRPLAELARMVVAGGATLIQLRDKHGTTRQHDRTGARHQGGARRYRRAAGRERSRRRGVDRRGRRRACRAGRHAGGGCAPAARAEGDHRSFDQERGARECGADRSARLRRRRRRLRDHLEGQSQSADRRRRPARHRRRVPQAQARSADLRHRRHRRRQCGGRHCGGRGRRRGDLGAVDASRSRGRGARIAQRRRPSGAGER